MRKVAMYLARGAIAAVAALAAAQSATAGPLTGIAGLGFYPDPNSPLTTTVDPAPQTRVTSLTSSVTEPPLLVRGADTLGDFVGVIPANTPAVFSLSSLPVPAGLSSAPISLTLTVDNFVFKFDTVTTVDRESPNLTKQHSMASFDLEFDGTILDGDGIFANLGTATLEIGCGQSVTGFGASFGPITCQNSLSVFGLQSPTGTVIGASEPASLPILGASLLGFGLLWRRRTL